MDRVEIANRLKASIEELSELQEDVMDDFVENRYLKEEIEDKINKVRSILNSLADVVLFD